MNRELTIVKKGENVRNAQNNLYRKNYINTSD